MERGRLGGVPLGPLAAVVSGALIVGLAIFAPGFDAQQTPVDTGTVWALNSDGVRYARVNAEVGELDTVKLAENPSAIVQTADALLIYTDGNSKVTAVDAASPVDIDETATGIQDTPGGTEVVVSSGEFVGYLTGSGEVFATRVEVGADVTPVVSDRSTEEGADPYVADVIAIDPSGILYSYSAADGTVLRYNIQSGRVVGEDAVTDAPDSENLQLTAINGTWVLLATRGPEIWIRGQAPVTLDLTGPVLQQTTSFGDSVVVAHENGLTSVQLSDGTATTTFAQDGAGVPAAPVVVGTQLFAAWLPQGDGPGTLWSSSSDRIDLDYADLGLDDDPQPMFQVSGSRVILNEVATGWVWTVPDGQLVPSSLDWSQGDGAGDDQEELQAEPPRVLELKPPVAMPDDFGVRAGGLVRLPVLLNDSDPNEDVLTVVADSLTGLDAAFGTVSVTNNAQEAVVTVAAGASGSATFSYRITDGTTPESISAPAVVTLTVVSPEVNTPPVWCGVADCLAEWPRPQVVPGGTVSVDVLRGWVDPEGDPIFVAAAANPSGVGTAIPTADGRVVYQHPDPNSAAGATIDLGVSVSDVRGAATDRPLTISVTPTPALRTEAFALSGQLGAPIEIDPRPFITGATSGLTLTGARILVGEGAEVAVNPAEVSLVLTTAAAGDYIIEYTAADEIAEETGLVRVTVLDAAAARVTTAPVVAFVRSKSDATIDVLSAVSNPTGRVLLLSAVQASSEPQARLAADLVGQSLLRVSGATDSGQPGLLGTVRYTVSDGTGNAAASAQGIASVYLVDAAVASAPIAVDDTATVRVGGQIDIPVLANDLAQGGASVALDPASVASPESGGLAYASGSLIKFVAPDVAGVYEVFYTAYDSTSPQQQDTARVTITVTDSSRNTPPQPRTLTGRVASGESVAIEFDPSGLDPDGDRVILNRVSTQPSSGSAAIAADGRSIVYTSVGGFQGQVEFEYEVRDARGETAVAAARVGVIDAEADPRPITYSDYLQVTQGAASTVALEPLLNDVNPRGGALTLIGLVPDAQEGTDEYDRLQALIVEEDRESGVITFRGAETLGPQAFIYTVANEAGDTAQGFIVLSTVRSTVADVPTILDTILTAATREQFSSGVDVLSGRVVWASGDPATLTLSLWRDQPGVTVDGRRIRGPVPDKTLIIPFTVTGVNFLGEEVTSYGLLTVLGQDELRLTLADPSAAQEVDEKKEISFDLADLVDYAGTASLEVDAAGVAASGRRSAATCESTSGTQVTYRAGAEAPWDDLCTVPVRIAGQPDFTYLAVQIKVISEDPQPQLRSAARTVSPGATDTYDLGQMTTWVGRAGTAPEYAISYSGTQFTVTQQGSSITVVGKDNARPGTEERISVSITNYEGVESAPVTLQVGLAPSTLPKGASVVKQCSQNSGSSCTISVIGASGEVNPLPGTPLTLISVASPTTCPGVDFAVSGSSVTASWTADAAGATCEGSFVVADAQGRQTSADRNGTVILDLQGYPKAPNSVTQVAYTADSVTVRVDPGAATSAYPALTGFTVSGGGASVSCTAAGVCPAFTGLTNGEQTLYTAVAVNSVGDSRSSVTTTAWAYRPPAAPTVAATATYQAGMTTAMQGAVDVEITTTDDADATASYLVEGTPVTRGADPTTTTVAKPVGNQTVSVQAISRFSLPPGTGPVGGSSTGTSNAVTVIGLPSVASLTAASSASGNVEAVATVGANFSPDTPVIFYVASLSGGTPTCQVDSDGELTGASLAGAEAVQQDDGNFAGLSPVQEYIISVCVGNGFGAAADGNVAQVPWGAGPPTPTGSFTIQHIGGGAGEAIWDVSLASTSSNYGVPPVAGYLIETARGNTGWGSDPLITARYCLEAKPSLCGPVGSIGPADAAAPYPARVSGVTTAFECRVGDYPPTELVANVEGIVATVFPFQIVAEGDLLPTSVIETFNPVPYGTRSLLYRVDVSWSGPSAGLGNAGLEFEIPCSP